MSYQEVYNGLNKKASNEQIKKLASIIGMKKQESLKKQSAVQKLAGFIALYKKAQIQNTEQNKKQAAEPQLPKEITSPIKKAPNSQYRVMQHEIKTNTPKYIKNYFYNAAEDARQKWADNLKYQGYQGRVKSPFIK